MNQWNQKKKRKQKQGQSTRRNSRFKSQLGIFSSKGPSRESILDPEFCLLENKKLSTFPNPIKKKYNK